MVPEHGRALQMASSKLIQDLGFWIKSRRTEVYSQERAVSAVSVLLRSATAA